MYSAHPDHLLEMANHHNHELVRKAAESHAIQVMMVEKFYRMVNHFGQWLTVHGKRMQQPQVNMTLQGNMN